MKMNLQKFAGKTNVFPVSDNQFKLGASKEAATMPADLETFSPSFSNGVETWTPMDAEGWQRAVQPLFFNRTADRGRIQRCV